MYTGNKYVPQMPPICHMYKLLHLHQWQEVYQYIRHIYPQWHQPCDQEYCTQTTTEEDDEDAARLLKKSCYVSYHQ